MPKTIQQLRNADPEELTAHDVVALVVLAGFCANPNLSDAADLDVKKLTLFSRAVADEFLLRREEAK